MVWLIQCCIVKRWNGLPQRLQKQLSINHTSSKQAKETKERYDQLKADVVEKQNTFHEVENFFRV